MAETVTQIEVRALEAEPFPYLVADMPVDDPVLCGVVDEFPPATDPGWRRYDADNEAGKYEGGPHMWGQNAQALYDRLAGMADILEGVFDLPPLSAEAVGGGYHMTAPGGRLEVHTDFNRSPDTGLYRRVNLITYLTRGWDDPGGHLQLWGDAGPVVDVVPEFGRLVAFVTSDRSWHGHPIPAKIWRRSFAAYLFSTDMPDGYAGDHSTIWHPAGGG
jgi:hypothetical protein